MQIHTIAHYSWVVFVEDEQILTLCFVLVIPGLPAQGEVQHRMLTDLNNDAFPHSPPLPQGWNTFYLHDFNTGSTVATTLFIFFSFPKF